MSVEVINVEVEERLLNLCFGLDAKWAVCEIRVRVVRGVSIESAVVLLVGVKNSSGNDLEIE
jgi:hypothetical protein